MLRGLSIRDIVLIDAAEIEFSSGFCVLTGETGAGKSILLDALGLALGGRASPQLIRHGKTQGSVTASFDIADNKRAVSWLEGQGMEAADTLLLRRTLYADGRSKAFINDAPVSAQALQDIGALLVEICGQHDRHGLLSASAHRALLDDYAGCGKELTSRPRNSLHESRGRKDTSLMNECHVYPGNDESHFRDMTLAGTGAAFASWRAAESRLEETRRSAEAARRQEDYLRHALGELEKLKPERGEEEKLAASRALLMKQAKLAEMLAGARGELSGRADIQAALRAAERILSRDRQLAESLFKDALAALDRAGSELAEALAALDRAEQAAEADPAALDRAEERLFALRAAARKHGCAVEELPEHMERMARELALAESQEAALAALDKEAKQHRVEYISLSSALSEKRRKAAASLEKAIAKELAGLKMGAVRFAVALEDLPEAQWGASGRDKVGFLVATNPGAPEGPLGKIASGGELSRVLLALKVALAGAEATPTLIFDEVDTGIGGAVADAVGKRLAKLSGKAQVLCVTHQPQVASYGTHHLKVRKAARGGETLTQVAPLSPEERREEIARMLAGASITDEARAAAEKLLETPRALAV